MKTETAIKILTRYIKGLSVMESEAVAENKNADAEHYRTDRVALELARNSLLKRKE